MMRAPRLSKVPSALPWLGGGEVAGRWLEILWSSIRQDVRKIRSARQNLSPDADHLARTGYVQLRQYVDAGRCAALKEQVDTLLQRVQKTTRLPSGALVEYRGKEAGNDWDHGMVDIQDAHLEFEIVAQALEDPRALEVCQQASTRAMQPLRGYVYVNRGVSKTRGLHSDSFFPYDYKGLVYLTDVADDADGPYTYLPKSHRFNWGKYASIFGALGGRRLSSDYRRSRDPRAQRFHAPAGTMVLSDQNGYHAGWPQQEGHERYVMVLEFREITSEHR